MCVVSLSLIVLVLGIVVYSENIKEIGIIKNTINKQSQIAENENITTVDVTNLETGSNINHQHIFKTNYNNTQHWNECTICHEKTSVANHSITTTWALGYESCEWNNSYTKTCSCGYYEAGNKPCVWDGKTYLGHGGFLNSIYLDNSKPKEELHGVIEEYGWLHAKGCTVCKGYIFKSYYMYSYGNGTIYNSRLGKNGDYAEYCRKSDGSRITCNNLGQCAKCGRNITMAHESAHINLDTGKFKCDGCSTIWGTVTHELIKDNNAPQTYKIILNISMGHTVNQFTAKGLLENYSSLLQFNNACELSNVSSDVKKFTLTYTAKLKPNIKSKVYVEGDCIVDGANSVFSAVYISPDSINPVITEISSGDTESSLTEWSKIKPIIIKGTENYCDTVSVKIVEVGNEKNVIFQGGANVTNQKFEISCIPEIEANTQGKKYKVIITDTCENSTEQEFEIAKVDAIPPEITSGESIGTEWAKEKLFDFTATDTGIGEVQIAFNDESKYELATANGNEFSRSYKFIGDVYSPKQAIVMYKDGLGNISSKEVTIDKLDNTAPTITNAIIHNSKLLVTANDIKEGLGEGSGVSKYRYITSTEKLTNPEITETAVKVNSNENIIIENISQVKYIYVVAEDLVGNTSNIYEVEVPQLVLTSKVNLSVADGKGGIELDWSDYDLEDKYFVIYRKEKNASEWEKIVPLEQKLTGGKYTDILGNDKTNPSTPTINIEGNQENNNIEITQESTDTGTKYQYYIESYDVNDISMILNKSNIIN